MNEFEISLLESLQNNNLAASIPLFEELYDEAVRRCDGDLFKLKLYMMSFIGMICKQFASKADNGLLYNIRVSLIEIIFNANEQTMHDECQRIIKLYFSFNSIDFKYIKNKTALCAVKYIKAHLKDQITLEEVSNYCGVSKNYMSQLVKNIANLTLLT